MNVFISVDTFSDTSDLPKKLLDDANIRIRKNLHGRSIQSSELAQEIQDASVLIAGTEKITEDVFQNAPNLKLIARVGIGLDGIDFDLCKKYGVSVTYTPDAPSIAVAELCVGMILDLAREMTIANNNIKSRIWHRHMGMLLYGKTVGIIGMGRIGKSLVHLLSTFNVNFLVHDIVPDLAFGRLKGVAFVSKEEVLENSDVVSIHIPLNENTQDFIQLGDIKSMKKSAFLVNTARGGIVNEKDLYTALSQGIIAGAAVDVYEEEPYSGDLVRLNNCLLTSHMGSATVDSRTDMELQAVNEAIRYFNGTAFKNEVFMHN
ncbi:MAG: phosphoglycerate dehydrogenase [Campylobacterota bacterium]|nr:phosphoglycerate dehydrogenase [Campylobacterota bacterium]